MRIRPETAGSCWDAEGFMFASEWRKDRPDLAWRRGGLRDLVRNAVGDIGEQMEAESSLGTNSASEGTESRPNPVTGEWKLFEAHEFRGVC